MFHIHVCFVWCSFFFFCKTQECDNDMYCTSLAFFQALQNDLHHIFISIIKPCEALWYLRNVQTRREDSCDECMWVFLVYWQDKSSSVWLFTFFISPGDDTKRNWKGADKHLLGLRETTALSYFILSCHGFIINGNLRIM